MATALTPFAPDEIVVCRDPVWFGDLLLRRDEERLGGDPVVAATAKHWRRKAEPAPPWGTISEASDEDLAAMAAFKADAAKNRVRLVAAPTVFRLSRDLVTVYDGAPRDLAAGSTALEGDPVIDGEPSAWELGEAK